MTTLSPAAAAQDASAGPHGAGRLPAPVPDLGPLESAVMHVLWDATQPLTVRQVMAGLDYTCGSGGPPAYTTVMTVMSLLWRKDMLARTQLPGLPGRAPWWYQPALTREQYLAAAITGILACAPDPAAVLRLVQPTTPAHPPPPGSPPASPAPVHAPWSHPGQPGHGPPANGAGPPSLARQAGEHSR
jgi:BlaI family transcriptional regulator, penicillinase repressor